MASVRRVTRRLSRTILATRPMSGRSSPSAQPARWADSGGDAPALEAIALDGVAAQQPGALLGAHPRRVAQAVGDGAGVRPGPVGVGVVALEEQPVEADLVAAAQGVLVVEDAPVDAALGVGRGRLGQLDPADALAPHPVHTLEQKWHPPRLALGVGQLDGW